MEMLPPKLRILALDLSCCKLESMHGFQKALQVLTKELRVVHTLGRQEELVSVRGRFNKKHFHLLFFDQSSHLALSLPLHRFIFTS